MMLLVKMSLICGVLRRIGWRGARFPRLQISVIKFDASFPHVRCLMLVEKVSGLDKDVSHLL